MEPLYTPQRAISSPYFLPSYRRKLRETVVAAMERNMISIRNVLAGINFDPRPKMVVYPDNIEIANIDDENGVDDPSIHLPEIADELYDSFYRRECEIRPCPEYIFLVQKYRITARARDKWVDWLVGTSEKIGMMRETMYMAIGYLDRYLSEKQVDAVMLGKVGVVCLMLADKHDEEEDPLGFNFFLRLTEDSITRKDFIELEWEVFSTIRFDLTPPTAHHFLVRYHRAARGGRKETAASTELENMAFLISELALASYTMIKFPPSMVAASAVFLARYALVPSRKPWSATLQHYSYYKAVELWDCVFRLHRLWFDSVGWTENIRQKYSMVKYGGVAFNAMPLRMLPEAFES